jgi:serine phosphatase RsbU (regulator of sigma subunit)
VGGDWYDAIHVHGVTTLIIGDVVGHNIAAAAQMGNLRSMLRGFVADSLEAPSRLLSRLDDANLRLSTRTMATAAVAQVIPPFVEGGPARVVWSSAGHLSPVVVDVAGGVKVLQGRSDLMLGVAPGANRADHEHVLEHGDTMLLFTDGLVERRGRPMASSLTQLAEILADLAQAPLEHLVADMVERMGAASERDDVAVLAVRLV